MFRYNKKELIDQIQLLPVQDIPAFLEKNTDTLAKLWRRDLQEVADAVISAMIQALKYQYPSIDHDISSIIRTLGPSVIKSKFNDLVTAHVVNIMPFLERHAQEIAQIYTPEQFLDFLASKTEMIFSEFKDFPIDKLNAKLTYTIPPAPQHSDDEDDIPIPQLTEEHDYCPENSIYSLPARIRGNIASYTKDRNFNTMTADQFFELSQLYTKNYRLEKNKIVIQEMKTTYDAEQLAIASANLTKANKIIALFANSFSSVSDMRPLLDFIKKLRAIDDSCNASVAERSARDEYSLVLTFLRAMRQAIKTPANMVAVMQHIEPSSRITFINEHDVFMDAKKHDQRHGKLHGLFAHRANAGDNTSHHTSEKVRQTH